MPLNVELKLEVWDSPNSAGIVIDAVRCAKLALDRKIGGALIGPSSYFMKSPPQQFTDAEARDADDAVHRRGRRLSARGVSAVTTTFFLVRHAAHDRVGTVLCGRMPGVDLGDVGLAQAGRLADRLAIEAIAAVQSSPLERARETAEPIADRLGQPLAEIARR